MVRIGVTDAFDVWAVELAVMETLCTYRWSIDYPGVHTMVHDNRHRSA